MQKPRISLAAVVLIGLWAVIFLEYGLARLGAAEPIPYSEVKAAIAAGRVAEVTLSQATIQGTYRPRQCAGKNGQICGFEAIRVPDETLLPLLEAQKVKVVGARESSFWGGALGLLLPLLALGLLFGPLLRGLGGGLGGRQGGLFGIGQSKAKIYMEKQVDVRFSDVAGVDEAREELTEVIEFLRTPDRFGRLGGKIPKGILLVGPPGTGKTLLARAVAGEASVPFFSMSGSEFVEMFVGVGAARVRDLFAQAKQKAPCIIFIDELDAIGRVRQVGGMAHEEREQTLNQLLVELDGFDARVGVILMAATNRPEVLDPALLRAGRFDRHVLVDRPDRKGRLAILALHARKVPLVDPADLEAIAGMTVGLVGADLANLVNEAALLAVRRNCEKVGRSELEEALERIIAGLEKKNRVLSPAERARVAHHEVGHALVALALPGQQTVQKISIVPRGISALGYTLQLPTEDRFLMTQSELEDRIAVLLGGRVAEQLTYHDTSTGAQDDLVKATDIARAMVRSYGMSPRLGHLSFDRASRRPLLDPTTTPEPAEHSDDTSRQIDAEVRRIVDEQYERATRILESRTAALESAAELLLTRETLSGEELRAVASVVPVPAVPASARARARAAPPS